ncbi:MAG TPA: alpha/beta fold hydrolase [Trebonia sp.]
MIEINETFTVAAPPDEVYRVLSDPAAVVECVEGASLGALRDDGSYDGKMTVKFSALRVSFAGRVALELDEEILQGTVRATGRDGQGGTKFQASASFRVEPADAGAHSLVTAQGEVVLSGKLASMIENAAGAVVRRMTDDFVTALSVRCASGSAEIGAGQPPSRESTESPSAGVLLLHGFGGSPSGLRAWGEALAAAGVAVSIPRLPGHGTRWQDLGRTGWPQWYDAAADALAKLHDDHAQVFVMGISLGATLALRLAELRPSDVAGVVAVNPVVTQVAGTPRSLALARLLRRSSRAVTGDARKPGVAEVGYDRIPLRAAWSLRALGTAVLGDLGTVSVPVLLGTSAHDHVVPSADGDAVWSGLPSGQRERTRFADSYHLVPVDEDAQQLFSDSAAFIRGHALAARP